MLGGIRAGGEWDDRGWDGWMASLTRWTWVWVNSGSWWWTGRPGVLQFMGSQRVGDNWVTEVAQSCLTLCDPMDCTCKASLSFTNSISLLFLSIRGQTEWKPQSQKQTKLITWTIALSNSMNLWSMLCRATQDGEVMVESSGKTWPTGEGNGKLLQYSCLENPMRSMKRPKYRTLKD